MKLLKQIKLDNASDLKIMFRIMVPMAKPAVITFILFNFIYHWNNYFWPLVMTNTDAIRTLPIGVALLKSSEGITAWNVIMAGNIILILPIILVYIFANKKVKEAFMYSGIK